MSLISALDNAILQIENTISTILGLADDEVANTTGFFYDINMDDPTKSKLYGNAVANTVSS